MSCAKQSNVRARRDRSYLRNRFHPTYCGIRSRCWPSRRLKTSGKYPFGLATAAFKQPTFARALIPRRNSKRSVCWRHQRSAQGVSVHRISSLPCSRRNLYGAQNPAIRLILTAPSRPRPRNHTLPICTVLRGPGVLLRARTMESPTGYVLGLFRCTPGVATTKPPSPSPTNSLARPGRCGNTTPSSSHTRRKPPETASTCKETNDSDHPPSDENTRSNGTSVRPTRGQADSTLGHQSPSQRLAPCARFPFWPGGERLIRAQPTPHTGRRYEC